MQHRSRRHVTRQGRQWARRPAQTLRARCAPIGRRADSCPFGRTQLPRVFPLFFSFAASSTRLPSSSFQFQRPRGGRRESLSSSLTLSPIAGIHTGLNISSIPTVTSKRTEKSQVLANLHVRHIYHRLLLFRVRENTPVLPHQALHMAMNSLRRCTKRESWLARRDAETAHR